MNQESMNSYLEGLKREARIYSKEQLLESYSLEHSSHKDTQHNLKIAQRTIASLRYDLKKTTEQYLLLHIQVHQDLTGDTKQQHQDLFDFFQDKDRHYKIHPNGPDYGYLLYTKTPKGIFIWYAYRPKNTYNRWYLDLLLSLFNESKIIHFVSKNHVLKNHVTETPEGFKIDQQKLERLTQLMSQRQQRHQNGRNGQNNQNQKTTKDK